MMRAARAACLVMAGDERCGARVVFPSLRTRAPMIPAGQAPEPYNPFRLRRAGAWRRLVSASVRKGG